MRILESCDMKKYCTHVPTLAALLIVLFGFRSEQPTAPFDFQSYWTKYNESQYLLKVEKNYKNTLICIQWMEKNGNASFPDMNTFYDAAVCSYMLKDSLNALLYLEKSVLKGMDLLNNPERIKTEVGIFAYDSVFGRYAELRKNYFITKAESMNSLLEDREHSTLDQFARSEIMRSVLDKEQFATIINYVDSVNMAEHVKCVKQGMCQPGGTMIYHLYGENEKYFPFIDSCLRVELFSGRMMPTAYAFWYDRQLSYVQHIPQKYGCNVYYTEFKVGAKAKISEIESLDSVDYYRSEIGLPPLWQSAEISGFDLPEGYKRPKK